MSKIIFNNEEMELEELEDYELYEIAAGIMEKFEQLAAEQGISDDYQAILDRTSHNRYDMIDMEESIVEDLIDGRYDELFADDVITVGFNEYIRKLLRSDSTVEMLCRFPFSKSKREENPCGSYQDWLADDSLTRFTEGYKLNGYVLEK